MDEELSKLHDILAYLEKLQETTEDQVLKFKLEEAIYKVFLVDKYLRTKK